MRKRLLLSVLLLALAFLCKAQPVTITPPSANIQPGESVTLTASGALYYQWSPATGLSTTEGAVTVASPLVTTTYTCSGYAPGAESVSNGDFSQGNTGFTSAYEYSFNLWNEGTYYVDQDVTPHHPSFYGSGHGGGNFMIVNGATSPGTNVWTEQISVNPHTYYAFSTWVCMLAGQAHEVAQLQFSINGNQIGDVFTAPPELYVWEQFYELWYSDNATSATITILNQNTVGSGNDFGLDDISFCELVLVGAPECTVSVGSMSASADADDFELCANGSTTLHALPVNGSGNYTYSWTPSNTLDDAHAQHPVATPPVGITTYTCHIVDVDWNNEQDVGISISVYPTYDETTIDTAICYNESFTFNGITYHTNTNPYDTYFTDHTQRGCDSIVRLNLTVWEDQSPADPIAIPVCPDQLPYYYSEDPNHTPLNEGLNTLYLEDNHGCEKIVRIDVQVSNYYIPPTDTVYVGYYDSPSYDWHIPEAIGSPTITYTTEGLHTDTLQTSACPGIFTLDLHFRYIPDTVRIDTTVCNSFDWLIESEFLDAPQHFNYTDSDTIFHQIPMYYRLDDPSTQYMYYDPNNPSTPIPCFENYLLYLTVNHESVGAPVTIDCDTPPYDTVCNSYPFFDSNIGFISFDIDTTVNLTGLTPEGCDYQVQFQLSHLKYEPDPDNIKPHDTLTVWFGLPEDPNVPDTALCAAVVTNTEFFSFQYTFSVEEQGRSLWDSCVWTISKPSWQIEQQFGADRKSSYCTVYVADRDEDYVKLTATAKNRCGEKKKTFYLKSSFLDIEEQHAAQSDFSIVPNPNNGQMKILFNEFVGMVDVKVYDVMGHLIDSFETFNDSDTKAMEYNLMGRKGIFFFVVNGKEGTVAKKVVIR